MIAPMPLASSVVRVAFETEAADREKPSALQAHVSRLELHKALCLSMREWIEFRSQALARYGTDYTGPRM